MLRELAKNVKRVALDSMVVAALFAVFALTQGGMKFIAAPAMLVLYKALLMSMGAVHGHITRKLIFPRVDWTVDRVTPLHVVAVAMYVSFILGYARGG